MIAYIQVISDMANNAKVFHSNVHMSYSVHNSGRSFLETTATYDKRTQQYSASVTDSTGSTQVQVRKQNILSFSRHLQGGWRTRGQVHSQEVEIIRNNIRFLKIDLSVNGHIPSATCKLTNQDRVDILLFAGVEQERKALLKVSHAYKGSEMEDLAFKVSLEDGNSVGSSVNWRSGALLDIQGAMRSAASLLEASDTATPWQHLQDTLEIFSTITNNISGDLIRLTNVELNQIFLQIKRVTSYARGFSRGSDVEPLIQYYS